MVKQNTKVQAKRCVSACLGHIEIWNLRDFRLL